MIPFNVPPVTGKEIDFIQQAIKNHKISGDGQFTKYCHEILEKQTGSQKVLLTTSCTHALEMAALLTNIGIGDEVIMPSYTFVSTANAFVLRGARVVFVDIRPDTLNIDENLIEAAVTDRTKAIVVVHYAGVACSMDEIMEIASRHGLIIIEDAAQGIMSTYKGRPLGSIGDIGCFSFHETKNLSMGEGGALLLNNAIYNEKAEIIREKGTNRSRFFRGQVDKYTWVGQGSSYLPSEINAAYLYAQLLTGSIINDNRITSWNRYYQSLLPLSELGHFEMPYIPDECQHNAHMFYIKLSDLTTRSSLIEHLKANQILAVFHYIPLHSSPAGLSFASFHGADVYTTRESERLLRFPLYYELPLNSLDFVVKKIYEFFNEEYHET